MRSQIDLREIQGELDGRIVWPSSDEYDDARAVFNARIQQQPRAVVQCASAGDVAAVLGSVRTTGINVAVRGGGRNVAGYGTGPGIVLDLGPMNTVEIDAANQIARFGGGTRAGELLAAARPHGLAAVTGVAGHIGAAGLTLGGGIGWLSPAHGFACDNIVAVDLVTWEGTQTRVDQASDPELMWAIRGAGANFGVVTALEVRLHPVPDTVLAGDLVFPLAHAARVVQTLKALNKTASDDFFFFLTYAPLLAEMEPDAGPVLIVTAGHVGDHGEAEGIFDILRAHGPLLDSIAAIDYVDLHTHQDDVYPSIRQYWAAEHVAEATTEIQAIMEDLASRASRESIVVAYPYRGAMSAAEPTRGAFATRDTGWDVTALAFWESDADDTREVAWAAELSDRLRSAGLVSTGVYPSMLSDAGHDRIVEYYGTDAMRRLQALKTKWDPRNTFSRNANIPPTLIQKVVS